IDHAAARTRLVAPRKNSVKELLPGTTHHEFVRPTTAVGNPQQNDGGTVRQRSFFRSGLEAGPNEQSKEYRANGPTDLHEPPSCRSGKVGALIVGRFHAATVTDSMLFARQSRPSNRRWLQTGCTDTASYLRSILAMM